MKYLVVDSGPLIKGVRLERFGAERYVTVPEVLGELRDSQARALLESLPFELELREPSDEAMKAGALRSPLLAPVVHSAHKRSCDAALAVKDFARLTGDLPVLSTVDLRVLALTWMLEKECRGIDHLRTTPPPRAPMASRRPPSVEAQADGAGAAAGEVAVVDAAGAGAMPGWPGEADGGAAEEGVEGDAAAEEAEEGGEGEDEVEEVLDDVPQRVLPGLYLGSLDAAQNRAALRARGVTHVLTVARELSEASPLALTPHPT